MYPFVRIKILNTFQLLHKIYYISETEHLYKILQRHIDVQQSGAVEACWAHNPEVRGSKPRSANIFFPLT